MDFPALRSYIDAELKKISDGTFIVSDSPRSKNDFLRLWQILQEKLKEQPQFPNDSDIPFLPLKPIPPSPFPDFKPSTKLAEAQKQLLAINSALQEKRRDPDATKRSIKKLEFKQKIALEEEGKMLLEEKNEYLQTKNEYFKPYKQAESQYHATLKQLELMQRKHKDKCDEILRRHSRLLSERRRFSDRILKEINSIFSITNRIRTETVFWRVLPPGEWNRESIILHYENLQRLHTNIEYDINRLQAMFSLSPSTCYIGIGEFDGYIVFGFKNSSSVFLECPVYGNAIYVIRDNWQSLARLSKQELLNKHPQIVHRIIHTGDWFKKLKRELLKNRYNPNNATQTRHPSSVTTGS